MNQSAAHTAQQVMAGATVGGAVPTFLSVYSSEITVAAVVTTCAFSIIFGFWNVKIQTKRNEINEAKKIEEWVLGMKKGDLDPTVKQKLLEKLHE